MIMVLNIIINTFSKYAACCYLRTAKSVFSAGYIIFEML